MLHGHPENRINQTSPVCSPFAITGMYIHFFKTRLLQFPVLWSETILDLQAAACAKLCCSTGNEEGVLIIP